MNSDVVAARRLTATQKKHFAVCVITPSVLSALVPILVPDLIRTTWPLVFLWPAMWVLVGGLGVSIGFHRLFAHRSFKATDRFRDLLAVLGMMAGQGTTSYWVSIHRHHHAKSDLPGDLHSPNACAHPGTRPVAAFLKGHIGWALSHDVPRPMRYARDLLADRRILDLDRRYWTWVALGVLIPTAVGFGSYGVAGAVTGAYWGGIVRLAVGHQIIWAVNSLGHCWGYRSYDTRDSSRNNPLVAVFSFGEGWQNNHHGIPSSCNFSRHWLEFDLGYLILRGAARLRWATNLKLRQSSDTTSPGEH